MYQAPSLLRRGLGVVLFLKLAVLFLYFNQIIGCIHANRFEFCLNHTYFNAILYSPQLFKLLGYFKKSCRQSSKFQQKITAVDI